MPYDKIPIIVVLWEHLNFTGRRAIITRDESYLWAYLGFWWGEIRVSSVSIHPGPDYDAEAHYEVSFFSGWNYSGSQLVLKPGMYPDLRYPYNFNDKIASVKFHTGITAATPISPIPVVGELYVDANYAGRKLILLEDVPNIASYAGFEDITSSVKVLQGPNYTQGDKLRLYRDRNYMGGGIDLAPGDYPNLAVSHGFNDVISSAKVK